MSALSRIREALTGGPTYTRPLPASASTKAREKNERKRAREADQAAARRRGHRESVVRNRGGDGTKFAFEEKRGWRRR
ncbi:hypothetical protein ABTX60_06865 [Streptomyces sp. NPDC126510]|uniref:hypothetical protein n=1 Tax=Streptomyces sp. NPDC126510 TaxID=3155317 RepID=UPI003319E44A